ncbi:acyltransferase family protein [Niabella drilacis]|uniref:Peptidoglycan/LPS O-acetylase OafA/YrhL, contains acyltransferase and SGNH-hydrolase domains n=1 Tax=Niabella drilacis (strain DSM 25811 / CCM 8410 / CCUG 62505 / LMG 26954 / E90) TaxID=1285928 RepID=A0A1G6WCA0_NIADE|nr:acyltransferase [Niabella drilacis]SDD63580.1 Peptidoglycan/LPS O-acetylase OafA/YrhL, contains acyltransferase and SGNH-hydrolase domains [Niabella drilacis]
MNLQRYYRPELDVFRFFAFLFVFCTHRMDLAPIDVKEYYWVYQVSLVGVFGVPLFFLLSAFLITELLLREKDATGSVRPQSFYIRRILRIWPLYFFVLTGFLVLSVTTKNFGVITTGNFLSFSLFAGNWYISFNEWVSCYPQNPLWSISVEEQFYLLIPLLAVFFTRKGLKAVAFTFLVIAYVVIFSYGRHPREGFSSEWTNSFVQFQFFAAGILLSVYLRGRQPRFSIPLRALLFIAGIGCWLIASLVFKVKADAPHLSNSAEAMSGWACILLGALLMFLSMLGTPGKYLPKPVIFLGRISYGLYMFHNLFYYLIYHLYKDQLTLFATWLHLPEQKNNIGFVLAFIGTVVTAMLSYRFLERPFLHLKRRFTVIPSRD